MLAVGDDELNTRDSEGMLFRCCQGWDMRRKSHRGWNTCRMSLGSHTDGLRRETREKLEMIGFIWDGQL